MEIDDPRIVATDDPVDGFAFYGPDAAVADTIDVYREARTRRLEEDGEQWWLCRTTAR
jgi:hypothetical protein